MIRNTDLVSYLPPFLADIRELKAALEAEDPEFELVWKAADKILSNEFIQTADENGISRFEAMLRLYPQSDDTLEVRRARVMAAWYSNLPYTYRLLIKKLSILCGGTDFSVTKKYGSYCISVITHLKSYDQIAELKDMLNKMLPANMIVNLYNSIAVKIGGSAVIYTGLRLSGRHKKIKTEVKIYGME